MRQAFMSITKRTRNAMATAYWATSGPQADRRSSHATRDASRASFQSAAAPTSRISSGISAPSSGVSRCQSTVSSRWRCRSRNAP